MIALAQSRVAAAMSLTVAILSGCSTPASLTRAQRDSLASQPVLYAVHYGPPPRFGTGPKDDARARFLDRAVPGRAPSRDFYLPHPEDPAIRIKEALAAELRTQVGVSEVRTKQLDRREDAVSALRKQFETGAVLDVRTLRWGLKDGFVAYRARVRLIDLQSGKIVWNAACEWNPNGHVDRAPGLDDLYADVGYVLQTALHHVADSCVRSLRASLLASERI